MQRENRRLAAIVAADIAGYSRLIGQDEEGTLRALREHRAELIDPLIEQHGGRPSARRHGRRGEQHEGDQGGDQVAHSRSVAEIDGG